MAYNWDTGNTRLNSLLSDFYLAAFTAHLDRSYYPAFLQIARKAARLFKSFLLAALGDEVRHLTLRVYPDWAKGIIREPRDSVARARWKRICYDLGITEVLDRTIVLFRRGNWRVSGYGGPDWVKVSLILQKFVQERISDVLFVDSIVSIEHSNEFIFYRWSLGYDYVAAIIFSKSRGTDSDYFWTLTKYATISKEPFLKVYKGYKDIKGIKLK